MLSRIIVSLAMTAVLFTAPMGVAGRSCILSSAPVQQACKLGSCANKICCATSSEHKSTPAHQLAKTDSGYDVNAAFVASAVIVPLSPEVASQKFLLSNVSVVAHSPPALAVLCSFLI
jgi:hypothetical protein